MEDVAGSAATTSVEELLVWRERFCENFGGSAEIMTRQKLGAALEAEAREEAHGQHHTQALFFQGGDLLEWTTNVMAIAATTPAQSRRTLTVSPPKTILKVWAGGQNVPSAAR